jgi:hypothetical protein
MNSVITGIGGNFSQAGGSFEVVSGVSGTVRTTLHSVYLLDTKREFATSSSTNVVNADQFHLVSGTTYTTAELLANYTLPAAIKSEAKVNELAQAVVKGMTDVLVSGSANSGQFLKIDTANASLTAITPASPGTAGGTLVHAFGTICDTKSGTTVAAVRVLLFGQPVPLLT